MRIAFFGGTFDPIHNGHLAVATAAAERFRLHRVLFAPAGVPALKQHAVISPFLHRYAMVSLATAHDPRFVPSSVDFRGPGHVGLSYSIDTIRQLKRSLAKSDRLFFLVGIDAFRDISRWHRWRELLGACEFIVSSRPGFSLEQMPHIDVPGARIHLLDDVWSKASATIVRRRVSSSRPAVRDLDPAVAVYIRKTGLYRDR